MGNKKLIDQLMKDKQLQLPQWVKLIGSFEEEDAQYAAQLARETAYEYFKKDIYIRGIVEFSNICKNDCYYCGIRKSNEKCKRYRLDETDILSCCEEGYKLGFRTFVLQSGEDKYFTAQKLGEIVSQIKQRYPDCAVTLSVGELERDEYEYLFNAGADRYLLRQETSQRQHYGRLHPKDMSWDNRMKCLENLKDIGYQTGAGIMVGTPFQTAENLGADMMFFQEFKPHMIGIGPFIPHKDTPFAHKKAFEDSKDLQGKDSREITLFLLSLCRIMLGKVLLPATTALGTVDSKGRERGVLAGANVIMPNLSPMAVRKKYTLYDNKEGADMQACESVKNLQKRMEAIGYNIKITRGDYPTND